MLLNTYIYYLAIDKYFLVWLLHTYPPRRATFIFDLKVPFKTHPRRPPCICCSCHTLSSERTFAANLCSLKINTFEKQTWIYIWRHQQILLIKKKTEIELLKANTLLTLRLGLTWLISGGVIRLDWNSKLGLLNLRSGAIATKPSGACDQIGPIFTFLSLDLS